MQCSGAEYHHPLRIASHSPAKSAAGTLGQTFGSVSRVGFRTCISIERIEHVASIMRRCRHHRVGQRPRVGTRQSCLWRCHVQRAHLQSQQSTYLPVIIPYLFTSHHSMNSKSLFPNEDCRDAIATLMGIQSQGNRRDDWMSPMIVAPLLCR